MKTLEAVNQILLNAGERQVREISAPPSLKAAQCIREAIQEFSLLGHWPDFTVWVTPQSWAGTTANFLPNTIKILECRDRLPNGKLEYWQYLEEWQEFTNNTQWKITSHNQVEVSQFDSGLEFRVTYYPMLPGQDNLDIDIADLFLTAILKRALALFILRHLEDAGLASQITAEYELMLNQLRSRARQAKNGESNIYRGGR